MMTTRKSHSTPQGKTVVIAAGVVAPVGVTGTTFYFEILCQGPLKGK